MRCPACASRMHYDLMWDAQRCELCPRYVGGEVIWKRGKTRLGRLWLWIYD